MSPEKKKKTGMISCTSIRGKKKTFAKTVKTLGEIGTAQYAPVSILQMMS